MSGGREFRRAAQPAGGGAPVSLVHRWIPGERARLTLLMLHGTGGNEDDLVPLGEMLAPGASLLSPRGAVLENGMPRFFRRLSEGVFDVPDLLQRTDDLAEFIGAAAAAYRFETLRLVAVGFSNGANIAASLLLRHAGLLAGAVLLRPMVPYVPEVPALQSGTPVLIAAGKSDPIASPAEAAALAELLGRTGARVTLAWGAGAHSLGRDDLAAAREWMDAEFPASGEARS